MSNQDTDLDAGAAAGGAAHEPAGAASPIDRSRRRLFRGAAGGAGVLLAVHAKTALGTGVCQSPSAMMSGNTSPHAAGGPSCSGGRSPGYWGQPQHFPNWRAAGVTPPEFNGVIVDCSNGSSALALGDITNTGTTFFSVFGSEPNPKANVSVTHPVSLWAPLGFKNSFVGGNLMFHCVAAYLNAKAFMTTAQQYPMTPQQVIEMFNAVATGGTYCPGSLGSCADPWNADDVIAYISGMYDINEALPNLCKQP